MYFFLFLNIYLIEINCIYDQTFKIYTIHIRLGTLIILNYFYLFILFFQKFYNEKSQ